MTALQEEMHRLTDRVVQEMQAMRGRGDLPEESAPLRVSVDNRPIPLWFDSYTQRYVCEVSLTSDEAWELGFARLNISWDREQEALVLVACLDKRGGLVHRGGWWDGALTWEKRGKH